MKPHIHAELIKQWADGAQIQKQNFDGKWFDDGIPNWAPWAKYRVNPDIVDDLVSELVREMRLYGCHTDRTFFAVLKDVLKKYNITLKGE